MSGCEQIGDIQGDHRFLCRVCNTRFLRYPQDKTWQRKPDVQTETCQMQLDKELGWDILQEALKKFQPGFVNRINKSNFPYIADEITLQEES